MARSEFKRAHLPEHREARRRKLLQAASDLLAQQGLEGVTLNGIAREAGITKSNIYRYFESREQILLELMEVDWADLVEGLEAALAAQSEGDPQSVATCLTDVFAQRPRACQLLSVLAGVLEKNLSEDAVRDFKLRSLGLVVRVANALHAALPTLDMEACRSLVPSVHSLVTGLWPMAHPSPAVARAYDHPLLAPLRVDFRSELALGLERLLRGELARRSGAAGTLPSA